MKVMNIGNANYANSRQQNFGMKPTFTTRAKVQIASDNLVGEVERAVKKLRTKNGREKTVIIDRDSDFRYLLFKNSRKKIIADALLLDPRETLSERIIGVLRKINDNSGK